LSFFFFFFFFHHQFPACSSSLSNQVSSSIPACLCTSFHLFHRATSSPRSGRLVSLQPILFTVSGVDPFPELKTYELEVVEVLCFPWINGFSEGRKLVEYVGF
ncbi:hypothetical protein LINPERPRIM_LOCUS37655, partial [Linum perenne]